MAFAQSKSS